MLSSEFNQKKKVYPYGIGYAVLLIYNYYL